MQAKISIVLATHNKGKKAEIKDLLANYPVEILDLNDFGPIPAIVEDGATFDENAYKKASFVSKILGLPALADDSGLVVEALGGAPGVYSARYAGENATDRQRYTKLLEEMKGRADRQAVFECVLSLAVPTGAALTYEGRCQGLVAEKPAGSGGFGYDPVFYYPPLKKTFGELSREAKSRISHRGKALGELKAEFDKVLIWIRQNMPIQEKFRCGPD